MVGGRQWTRMSSATLVELLLTGACEEGIYRGWERQSISELGIEVCL